MHFCVKMCVSMLAIALLLGLAGVPAGAQDKQHVVSLSDLNKDAARPAQTRQSNEEAVRTLLSSDQAQKALKSANLDYQKGGQSRRPTERWKTSPNWLSGLARRKVILRRGTSPIAICFGLS